MCLSSNYIFEKYIYDTDSLVTQKYQHINRMVKGNSGNIFSTVIKQQTFKLQVYLPNTENKYLWICIHYILHKQSEDIYNVIIQNSPIGFQQ